MSGATSEPTPGNPGAALLESPVRRAIVEALQRYATGDEGPAGAGGMTAARLADQVGLHVTTVRFHLDQLDAAGLVVSHFTTAFGVGRPRKVYAAASTGQGDAVSHLKLLAGLLTASFGAGVTPDQAGRQWVRQHVTLAGGAPAATTAGAWLTKIGRLVDVLQQWGYSPDLTTSDGGRSCRIDLVDCPFLDLARANPEVVCGIHRGLLAGVLERLGEERAEVSLRPFVGPSLCHAQISTRQPFQTASEDPPDAT